MNLLTANICEEEDDDDLGLGYVFGLSELQVTRKAKKVHQSLNWLAHVKKIEHENIFAQTYRILFQALTILVDVLYQYFALELRSCWTAFYNMANLEKSIGSVTPIGQTIPPVH
jgi:hypothetical protein